MNKLLVIGIIILLFAIFFLAFLPFPGDAAKYPPGVAAIVKLRNTLPGPALERPGWIRRKLISRRYNAAMRANNTCPVAQRKLLSAHRYMNFKRPNWAMARILLNEAKDWSYRCNDTKFRKLYENSQ